MRGDGQSFTSVLHLDKADSGVALIGWQVPEEAINMATIDQSRQLLLPGRLAPDRKKAASVFCTFPHPSLPSVVWSVLDLFTAMVSIVIAFWMSASISRVHGVGVHLLFPGSSQVLTGYVCWYVVCLIYLSRSYGLYGPVQSRGSLHEQRMTLQASLIAGAILCGTLYISGTLAESRVVVLLAVALVGLLLCIRRAIWRQMVYRHHRVGLETRNVLIIGAGPVAQSLRNHLESLCHLGFRFKGFVALTEHEVSSDDTDIIGNVGNCLSLARSLFVDEILLSVPADRSMVISLVEDARAAGIDVRIVPDLYDGLGWDTPVEYMGRVPMISLHRQKFPLDAFILKRILDVTVSAVALLCTLPICLAIMIAVGVDSPGPIFYEAERVGMKGRAFKCFKFRTMVPNADLLKKDLEHLNEREGVLFKIENDPRITRVGRILRKYSLDELPQFYNVLRGDMSLVGPRPPIASEVEQYDLAHLRRLEVLPGITGLWQVEARQNPSFNSYISLDSAYVDNWTVWLDLTILARTIGVVLSGTGS